MPFQKGQSGNPGGRKRIPDDVKAAFAQACPQAVATLVSLLQSKNEAIRLRAAEVIINRHLGRVPEAAPVAVDEGKHDTLDFVPAVVTTTAAE
jgi:hypothetical protein